MWDTDSSSISSSPHFGHLTTPLFEVGRPIVLLLYRLLTPEPPREDAPSRFHRRYEEEGRVERQPRGSPEHEHYHAREKRGEYERPYERLRRAPMGEPEGEADRDSLHGQDESQVGQGAQRDPRAQEEGDERRHQDERQQPPQQGAPQPRLFRLRNRGPLRFFSAPEKFSAAAVLCFAKVSSSSAFSPALFR